jgi:hypothetical protein
MMRKLVRVYGPSGCDEMSYGTERFVKHEDNHFDVPEEALPGLLTVGGFTLAPVQPADDAGDEVAAALRAGPDQTSREGQTAAKAAAFRDANSCTPAAKEAGAADGGVEHTTEGPAASSMFAVWQDRGQTALCLLV